MTDSTQAEKSPFKPIQYWLEIYAPGTTQTCLRMLRASSPFPAIHAGELITLDGEGQLEAVTVEHFVWEAGTHIGCKTMVYTQWGENTKKRRLGQ